MTLEKVLERFDAKRNGSQWLALCPAHADTNPSLSIREDNGKILLYCHAHCAFAEILAAVNLKPSDLRTNSTAAANPEKAAPTPDNVKAVYSYRDEAGKLLFQIHRFEQAGKEKNFRARRPDGADGWIENVQGVRLVPYNLPAVIAAQHVVITEGEKDADTAQNFGLVATCNPFGAGKWKNEYSELLCGKNIVIIPDADDAGRKHAEQVAKSLLGKATSLAVCPLPNPIKDLTAYAELGFSRESLLELIKQAPPYTPKIEWESTFHRISELPQGESKELIRGYMEEGFSFLGAKSGAAKTWLGISEAKSLRTGEKLLGVFEVPQQLNVLYLVPEMLGRRFRNRCELLGINIEDSGFRVRTMSDGAPLPLNDPLLWKCIETMLPLVYLDTAIRFNVGKEENSADDVNTGIVAAAYQLIQLGCPGVRGLHHRAKDASDDELTLENVLRGSGDFGASAITVWGGAHETALRAGKLEQFDSVGRKKPDTAARDQFAREYLRESKRLGRCRFDLVKPGDHEPLLWEFRIQLRPSIDERGEIEMLTACPLPGDDKAPLINELFLHEPQASVDDLAKALGVSKATAWRRAAAAGWVFDTPTNLWKKSL